MKLIIVKNLGRIRRCWGRFQRIVSSRVFNRVLFFGSIGFTGATFLLPALCAKVQAQDLPPAGLTVSRADRATFNKWMSIYQKEFQLMVQSPKAFARLVNSGGSSYLQSVACVEELGGAAAKHYTEQMAASAMSKESTILNYVAAQEVLMKKEISIASLGIKSKPCRPEIPRSLLGRIPM